MSDPQLSKNATIPAYRYKWFWIIISPLILVLIACTITITIAVKNADDVVIGNYYKEGLLVNEKNDQERMANVMALDGDLSFSFAQDDAKGSVVLELDSQHTPRLYQWPDTIELKLSHPAFADRDIVIHLEAQPSGVIKRYIHNLETSLDGRWYWQLLPIDSGGDALWLMKGEVNFDSSSVVLLRSQ